MNRFIHMATGRVRKIFTPLAGCGIRSMWLIFQTEMLIYQSTANLGVKTLFREIAHRFDTEIRKILVGSLYGNKHSTFRSGP